MSYFEKSCMSTGGYGCLELSDIYLQRRNNRKARYYYKQGCNRGVKPACAKQRRLW